MTDGLYEMTVEELFNYYYFSRANMERSVKCHASESAINSYAIVINNIINEVKDRINSSVDSHTGENVAVYDAEAIMTNIGEVPYKGSARRVLMSAPTIVPVEGGTDECSEN